MKMFDYYGNMAVLCSAFQFKVIKYHLNFSIALITKLLMEIVDTAC